MKALRLVLRQSGANYKREETVDNKMTYPLPPFSTVIGALHSACGYREYVDMDISIQGRYGSKHREPYTDFCFLNSTQDDRGMLVKMKNASMLSPAFEKVASAKKPQGNSFREGITIQVHNQELLEEYRRLKDLNDELTEFKKQRFQPAMELLKMRKKALSEKKKIYKKDSTLYARAEKREKELKQAEKQMKERLQTFQKEKYEYPVSKFRTLTKSMKFYEILDDIELIIHVKAEENVLNDIFEHRYEIKSIGRSEDFVSVEEAKMVDLLEKVDDEVESEYSAYLDFALFRKAPSPIFIDKKYGAGGTRYWLNKNYTIIDGKRKFEKKNVLYVSGYTVDQFGDGLYLDSDGEKKYIVNFL